MSRAQPADTSSPVSVPPPGTYTIDAGSSEIRFTTRHMFGTGKVVGTFSGVTGVITVAEKPTESRVVAQVSAESFRTGHKKRDSDVRSKKFLHVEEHPHIEFEAVGAVERDGHWIVEGELTARGKSAPLHLTVTKLMSDTEGIVIAAEGTVDRYAHGITAMKGMAGRRLQLSITGQARRS